MNIKILFFLSLFSLVSLLIIGSLIWDISLRQNQFNKLLKIRSLKHTKSDYKEKKKNKEN